MKSIRLIKRAEDSQLFWNRHIRHRVGLNNGLKRGPKLNKRGVSPLIATVLLIAFAVALGAVVMNWGSSYVSETGSDGEGCAKVRISWFKRGDEAQVCFSPREVIFTVESNNMDVSNLRIVVQGDKDVVLFDDVLKSPLMIADIKKLTIPYDVNVVGTVKHIRVVPKLKAGSEIVTCPSESALEITNPPKCT